MIRKGIAALCIGGMGFPSPPARLSAQNDFPQRDKVNKMAQKVAYVTGGMGGIGTAICQRLHKEGFKVIAGCGPTRDFDKWLGEQKALGYSFYASVGNVGGSGTTVEAFNQGQGRARQRRRAGQQRRHHARPHVPEDDARTGTG